MTINTYGTLKTAVGNYLNRTDLTTYIPDLVSLAATRIFYGGESPYNSQPLRIPAMQAQDTGSVSGGYISFPTNFIEPIRLYASDGNSSWALDYVSAVDNSSSLVNPTTANTYTYLNNSIYTGVSAATTYTLDYYQAFTLSLDADTNWILTNAPSVYLYSTLVEAAPFLGDDPRIAIWFGLYRSIVNGLNVSSKKQGSGLVVRTNGAKP
jgi:hypothetical protein